ncbi:ribosome biogenesis protein SLX9-domain-containing protein [Tuber brumale]|nr:ribosome biogenesis protein SLX9-domain-containing protein [Tuber brumale]
MAQIKPTKRISRRDKASTSRPVPSARPAPAIPLQVKKKTRQSIKHSLFVSKIEKSSAPSARSRRRKAKAAQNSLITGLESLADALPSGTLDESINFTSASSKVTGRSEEGGIGRKSMKSRPGAMKRKEGVVKSECERFGKNLAIMQAGAIPGAAGGGGTWAALRGFIEGTMEKKEEFAGAD